MQNLKKYMIVVLFLSSSWGYCNVSDYLKAAAIKTGLLKKSPTWKTDQVKCSKIFSYGDVDTIELRDAITVTVQLAKGKQDCIEFYGRKNEVDLWVARENFKTLTILKVDSIEKKFPQDTWDETQNDMRNGSDTISCTVYLSNATWLNVYEDTEVELLANASSAFKNLKVCASEPSKVRAFTGSEKYDLEVSSFNNVARQRSNSKNKFGTFTKAMREQIKRKLSQ